MSRASRSPGAAAPAQASAWLGGVLDDDTRLQADGLQHVRGDRNLVLSATPVSLNLRSFLCVPLIGWESKRLALSSW